MLQPKQIIPICSGEESSFAFIAKIPTIGHGPFLVSFSGPSIYILNGALSTVQVIACDLYDLSRNISHTHANEASLEEGRYFSCQSFAWNRVTGQFCVCLDRHVLLFELRDPSIAQWVVQAQLVAPLPVKCVDWSEDGRYVVAGGSGLYVWDMYEIVEPKEKKKADPLKTSNKDKLESSSNLLKVPIPLGKFKCIFDTPIGKSEQSIITTVSFAPGGRFFFTLAGTDSSPKVWYRRKLGLKGYDFIYLRHPANVLSLSWRTHPTARGDDVQNVLLSTCADGEMRLWVESERQEKLSFVIQHAHNIGENTKVDWIAVNFDHAESNSHRLDFQKKKKKGDREAVSQLHALHTPNTSRHTDIRAYSRNYTHTILDWIIAVKADGTVTIFKIKDLPLSTSTIIRHSSQNHILRSYHMEKEMKVAAMKCVALRLNSLEESGSVVLCPSFLSLYILVEGRLSFDSWGISMGESNGVGFSKLLQTTALIPPNVNVPSSVQSSTPSTPVRPPVTSMSSSQRHALGPSETAPTTLTGSSSLPYPATTPLNPSNNSSGLKSSAPLSSPAHHHHILVHHHPTSLPTASPSFTPTKLPPHQDASRFIIDSAIPTASKAFNPSLPHQPDSYYQLRLLNRSRQHQCPVRSLSSHPTLPLVASLDESGTVIVWCIADTAMTDPTRLLLDLCSITCRDHAIATCKLHPAERDDEVIVDPETFQRKLVMLKFTSLCWDAEQSFLYLKHCGGIATYFIPYRENVEWPPISEYPSIMPTYIGTNCFSAFSTNASPSSSMTAKPKRAFLSEASDWEKTSCSRGSDFTRTDSNNASAEREQESDPITEIHLLPSLYFTGSEASEVVSVDTRSRCFILGISVKKAPTDLDLDLDGESECERCVRVWEVSKVSGATGVGALSGVPLPNSANSLSSAASSAQASPQLASNAPNPTLATILTSSAATGSQVTVRLLLSKRFPSELAETHVIASGTNCSASAVSQFSPSSSGSSDATASPAHRFHVMSCDRNGVFQFWRLKQSTSNPSNWDLVSFCRFDINSQLRLPNLRVLSISGVAQMSRVSVHVIADAPPRANNAAPKPTTTGSSMAISRSLAGSGMTSLSSSASSICDDDEPAQEELVQVWELGSSIAPQFRLESSLAISSVAREENYAKQNRAQSGNVGLASPILSSSMLIKQKEASGGKQQKKKKRTDTRRNRVLFDTHDSQLQMKWLTSPNGTEILALAKGSRIAFVVPQATNNSLTDFAFEWAEFCSLDTQSRLASKSLDTAIRSFCWLSSGVLIAADSSALFVYSRWIGGEGESGLDLTRIRNRLPATTSSSASLQFSSPPQSAFSSALASGASSQVNSMTSSPVRMISPTQSPPNELADARDSAGASNPSSISANASYLAAISESHSALPEYHPRVLIECLMAGWIERMGVILKHLYTQLVKVSNSQEKLVYIPRLPLRDWITFGDESAPEEQEESKEADAKGETNGGEGKGFGSNTNTPNASGSFHSLAGSSASTQAAPSFTSFFDGDAGRSKLSFNDILSKKDDDLDDLDLSFSLSLSSSSSDSNEYIYGADGSVKKKPPKDKSKKNKKDAKKGKKKANDSVSGSEDRDGLSRSDFESGEQSSKDAAAQKKLDGYTQSNSIFARASKNGSGEDSDRDALFITTEESHHLAELLSIHQLPGVNTKEQMQLLAVVETLSAALRDGKGHADKCAVKYKLMSQIFQFLRISAPPSQRPGRLTYLEMAWALHSESHQLIVDELIAQIDPLWRNITAFGFPLWLCDHQAFLKLMDSVSRQHYMVKKDPNESALFHIAMDKVTALAKLYELDRHDPVKSKKVSAFLMKDFKNNQKNRTSAETNAYNLMKVHNVELAIAFFILAGNHKSAISLCIDKLQDFQLALMITRLVEGGQDGPMYRSVLEKNVLPLALRTNQIELASMALWLLKRYEEAVEILISPSINKGSTTYLGANGTADQSEMTFTHTFSKGDPRELMEKDSKEELGSKMAVLPSRLYLFQFMSQSQLLRNRYVSFDARVEEELRRNAHYYYYHSGCVSLTFEKKRERVFKRTTDSSSTVQSTRPSSFASFSSFSSFYSATSSNTTNNNSDNEGKKGEECSSLVRPLLETFDGAVKHRYALQYFSTWLAHIAELSALHPNNASHSATVSREVHSLLTDLSFLATHHYQVNAPEILKHLRSSCVANGYFRPHYFLLMHQGSYREAGKLLSSKANHISDEATLLLATVNTDLTYIAFNANSTGANARHHMRHHVLESAVRNVFVCLHEFNNVYRAQAQMVANARDLYSPTHATREFPSGHHASSASINAQPSHPSPSSSTLASSHQPSSDFLSLIVDFGSSTGATAQPMEKREDVSLSTDDLIIIIMSLQLGLFSCAWLVGDFLTLFELLQGKMLDQLTKSAISPFRRENPGPKSSSDETPTKKSGATSPKASKSTATPSKPAGNKPFNPYTSTRKHGPSGFSSAQSAKERERESLGASGEKEKEKAVSANSLLDDFIEEAKDSYQSSFEGESDVIILEGETKRFLVQFVKLLILNKFITVVLAYLTTNLTSGSSSSALVSCLTRARVKVEYEFHTVPAQILKLRVDEKFQKQTNYKKHSNAHFFGALIRFADLFGSGQSLECLSCVELLSVLLDDVFTADYIEQVYFVRQNFQFKTMEEEAERRSEYLQQGKTKSSIVETEEEEADEDDDDEFKLVENKMVFGQPRPIAREKNSSLISSFAINSVNNQLCAFASANGIHEVTYSDVNQYRDVDEVVQYAESKVTKRKNETAINDISSIMLSNSPSKRVSKSKEKLIPHSSSIPIWSLRAHPRLPYYLSGSTNGIVTLWQWGTQSEIAEYKSQSKSRANRIQFSVPGTRFASCFEDGHVALWRWSDQDESLSPYRFVKCYPGRATDVTFLNSGGAFVTTGSPEGDGTPCVRAWDTLLPNPNVWNCETSDVESSCVVYSPVNNMLYCGLRHGGLTAIDIRQRLSVFTVPTAHDLNCKTLALDVREKILFSGSSDGNIKVWKIDSDKLVLLDTWLEAHRSTVFVKGLSTGTEGFTNAVSTHGVVQLHTTPNNVYSTGSDGVLLQRSIYYTS